VSSPAASPLSPPPPPTATRLNRRALAVAAALVAALGLLVAFSLRKEQAPASNLPAEGTHEPSEPAFLRREPQARIESPEEFFDGLHERQQAAMEFPDASLGSVEAPATFAPEPAPTQTSADPAHEAFTRALRAPLRPDGAHQQALGRPEAAGPSLPLLPNLPAGFPRLPGLDALTNPPGLALQAPPAPQAEPGRFERFQGSAPAPANLGYQLVPAAPYRLQAGTVLPAALLSAIDSGLPGQILAVLTRDVYDSAEQRHLILPRGARLLGRYDHQIAVGQDRLLVGWERLLLPDGTSLTFPALPAVDSQGRAGLSGRVDNHLWRVFGSALLLSVVSAGAQLSQPQVSADFGQAPSTRQVASAALGQELSSAALEILRRSANIAPTIRIPAGTGFSVFLAGDLTFERPWGQGGLAR
jgi:type IV secretory pathway VirB10-like protein